MSRQKHKQLFVSVRFQLYQLHPLIFYARLFSKNTNICVAYAQAYHCKIIEKVMHAFLELGSIVARGGAKGHLLCTR